MLVCGRWCKCPRLTPFLRACVNPGAAASAASDRSRVEPHAVRVASSNPHSSCWPGSDVSGSAGTRKTPETRRRVSESLLSRWDGIGPEEGSAAAGGSVCLAKMISSKPLASFISQDHSNSDGNQRQRRGAETPSIPDTVLPNAPCPLRNPDS